MTWLKISGAKAPCDERSHSVRARRGEGAGRWRQRLMSPRAAAHVAKESRRSVALVRSHQAGNAMKLYEFAPTRSIRVRWTLQEFGRRLRGHYRQSARRRAPQSRIP